MINITEKKNKEISLDFINKFKLEKVLLKVDIPLLVLMESPIGEKWLFYWYGSNENFEEENPQKEIIEKWMAFKVSTQRLKDFLDGHLSLREVILLAQFDFYLLETNPFPKVINRKLSSPEKIQKEDLPKYDITLDGRSINLLEQVQDKERFNISVHFISDKIQFGEIPLSISGPFEDNLQKYMRSSVHSIEGKTYPSEKDWFSIYLNKSEEGSFIMFLSCPEKEPAKIEILDESCKILQKIVSINEDFEITNIIDKIGQFSFNSIEIFLHLISHYDLSINFKWVSKDKEEDFLIINKRIADKVLDEIKIFNNNYPTNVSLVIELTPQEILLLKKPIKGQGGFQDILKMILERLDGNKLTLEPSLVSKIYQDAQKYGGGGFQSRLGIVVNAIDKMCRIHLY